MNTNPSIPTIADFSDGIDFPLCSARLLKDAGSNVANQGVCQAQAVTVIQGKLEYGHLFTMTGEGNDFTIVCKRHYNVAVRKPINITFIRIDLNNNQKEDTMSTNPECLCNTATLYAQGHSTDCPDYNKENNMTTEIHAAIQGLTDPNTMGEPVWPTELHPKDLAHFAALEADIEETYGATIEELVQEITSTTATVNPTKCGNTKVHGKGNDIYHDGPEGVKFCFMGNTPAVVARKLNVRTSSYDTARADRMEKDTFNSGRKIPNPYANR